MSNAIDNQDHTLEEELVDDEEDKGPTLDDVLHETSKRSRRPGHETSDSVPSSDVERDYQAIDEGSAQSPRPLLGEVVETGSLDHPGRVLVRWLDGRGRVHERWLTVLRGMAIEQGDSVLITRPANFNGWVVTGALQRGAPRENVETLDVGALQDEMEIRVDGKRVELEGQDEIVLRCGEASITLRRNGRVVIRGTYVETYSKGTNRIKGGSVQIN
jgi:hypothetical protein